MTETISRDELKSKLDGGAAVTLIEALPNKYYADQHLPGAINIPHDEVDALAPKVIPDKSAEIVVYCASAQCKNSGIAAERLAELGYVNVRDYYEGKSDWLEAGYPVESSNIRVAAE